MATNTNRLIIHFDLDYYYAQVEELRHPEAKGKPIVVCMFSGRTADSGAVATANYAARKYGVKAGIPIFQAKQKLAGTGALFLPVDHAYYAQMSEKIMLTAMRFADAIEPASIDEAFLDVSERTNGQTEEGERIAIEIKNAIKKDFGLTCSVGIGPNKLIAKMAAGMNKPDGLTVIESASVQEFLDPLPVKEIPGIGPKTSEALDAAGIRTIAQLRKADRGWLLENFGKKYGTYLVEAAQGIDNTPVGLDGEQKQFSRIMTLKRDSSDVEFIMESLQDAIRELKNELIGSNKSFSVVGINAIDKALKPYSKSRSLPHPSQDDKDIERIARELFNELISTNKREFRRAGIRVEKLEDKKGQKTLDEF